MFKISTKSNKSNMYLNKCNICMSTIKREIFLNYLKLKSENSSLYNEYNELYLCCPELDLNTSPNAMLCADCFKTAAVINQFIRQFNRSKHIVPHYNQHSYVFDNSIISSNNIKTEEIDLSNLEVASCTENNYNKSTNSTYAVTKLFKCLQCNYCSIYKNSVKAHMRIHTNEKPFKCLYCSYSAAWKSNLKMHIDIHTNEKPFKCMECSYSCTRKYTLKMHMLIHTNEKPFKCIHCPYSSTFQRTLEAHIRIHTKEKPFKCLHCKYSSAQRGNLKTHMYIHTNEKPFKCLHCPYSTTRKYTLRMHLIIHKKENTVSTVVHSKVP